MMRKEDLLQVKPCHLIGEDERGMTVDFSLPRQQADFVLLTRKQGSLSGNTYHEGKNSGTRPKVFVLISGQVEFHYRLVGTQDRYHTVVQAPAVIEVAPRVVHKAIALTDITILECNSILEIQDDRIKEEV